MLQQSCSASENNNYTLVCFMDKGFIADPGFWKNFLSKKF